MTAGASEQVRYVPERATLAAVLVGALGAIPLGASSPYLAPVLLLPVVALVWVLRARVVATSDGLQVCNGLAVHRCSWAEVDRFTIPRRGPVVLHLTNGSTLTLTALPRPELRRLVELGGQA